MTLSDQDLEAMLGRLGSDAPSPSAALQARVLADAAAVQPRPQPRIAAPPRRPGLWQSLTAAFGGGRALAGMTGALFAGVCIGLVQPAPVAALTSVLLVAEAPMDRVDLLPDAGALWGED